MERPKLSFSKHPSEIKSKKAVKILRRTRFIDTGRPGGAHNPDSTPNYAARATNINLTIMA
jgi:hypothetical protein